METLKRYTGIGTGKCQGKCCLVNTMRLMAHIRRNSPGPDRETRHILLPTIRQPVLPMRIDDIIEAGDDS